MYGQIPHKEAKGKLIWFEVKGRKAGKTWVRHTDEPCQSSSPLIKPQPPALMCDPGDQPLGSGFLVLWIPPAGGQKERQ